MDNSFTIFLVVAQVTPDDAQLLRILGSVGTVPGAVFPAFVAPVPLVPTGGVPPELLIAPVIPITTVADETGRLSMSVPSTWSETDGVPDFNDDGSDRPRVAVASDLDGFYSDWLVPGAEVTAFPFNNDPSALLRNLGYPDLCRDGGIQSFDNGTYMGLMQTWQIAAAPRSQYPLGDQPDRQVSHRVRPRSSYQTPTMPRCKQCCHHFSCNSPDVRTAAANYGEHPPRTPSPFDTARRKRSSTSLPSATMRWRSRRIHSAPRGEPRATSTALART